MCFCMCLSVCVFVYMYVLLRDRRVREKVTETDMRETDTETLKEIKRSLYQAQWWINENNLFSATLLINLGYNNHREIISNDKWSRGI